MNQALYHRLIAAGVFDEPARDIAAIHRAAEPDAIITVFNQHVAETNSIRVAVWRLRNGILATERAKVHAAITRTRTYSSQ